MKKKLISLMMAVAMTFGLTSCGSASSDGYTVGICQLVQHEALDAATQGFKDALVDELGEEKVTFDEQNASGDSVNCSTIVNGFVSKNVDLILANATGALTAATSATNEIPVLGTAITAYSVALDLDEATFTGTVGGNVSGTSDLAPLDEQAAMILEWFPDAKEVGIIYCSAEANSVYQVNEITKALADLGVNATAYAFTDSNDVTSVTNKACETSDVIYIPTDNTAASNTEAIANVVVPAKVPVIAGEAGICKGCGIATLSISYYDLGYTTGKMAAKVLTGETDISEMPIEYAPVTKYYNAELAEQYGLTPVEGYEVLE
ncbi:MAG: ABC transporter substrate-binding protein [Acetatifactor sp.]|nr:ABC transporter substrate-binding protein [Acetatifactor sp.]